MLKPIINLVITQNEAYKDYQKTILFDTNTISLKLEDTKDIEGANNVPYTYDILEPIHMANFRDLEYVKEDMSYQANIYVPIFKEDDDKKREKYLYGQETRSLEYIKFPVIDEDDRYKVVELYQHSMAGTDEIGDVICIFIGFFNGFTESEVVENLLENSKEARKKIPTVLTKENVENMIYSINVTRKKEDQPIVKYRYHTLDNKTILLDMNLSELIKRNIERGSIPETIDLSFFDKISTMMNSEIIYNKNALLKSGIQILLNKDELERLMQYDFSEKTWNNYIKKGFFKTI